MPDTPANIERRDEGEVSDIEAIEVEVLHPSVLVLRSVINASLMSIASMGHLHQLFENFRQDSNLLDNPGISFAFRFFLGIAAGVSLEVIYRKVMQLSDDERKSVVMVLSALGLLHGAYLVDGAAWVAMGSLTQSAENNERIAAIQSNFDESAGYIHSPYGTPHSLEAIAEQHKAIVGSVDSDFNIKAAAKMLLFFDGQKVELNPSLAEEFEVTKAWEEGAWTINYRNPESWIVTGPSKSWHVGEDSLGDTPGQFFEDLFGEQELFAVLKKILDESGKIDEKSAIREWLPERNKDEEAELRSELEEAYQPTEDATRWSNAFAPYEWNDFWLEKAAERSKAISEAWEASVGKEIQDSLNLGHEEYAPIISQIDQL